MNVREVRRGGAVTVSNWTTTNLRWEVGGGVDVWPDRGRTAALNVGADQRLARDRVSLRASAAAFAGSFSSWTFGAVAEWRSAVRHEGHVVIGRGGVDLTGARAPFALWPGAGLGHARGVLLRAHPLLDDGVITGDVFGRRVYHAGSEWRRWFKPGLRIVPIAPAVFVDVAGAEKRAASWLRVACRCGSGHSNRRPRQRRRPTRYREGPSRWRDGVFDWLDEMTVRLRPASTDR